MCSHEYRSDVQLILFSLYTSNYTPINYIYNYYIICIYCDIYIVPTIPIFIIIFITLLSFKHIT